MNYDPSLLRFIAEIICGAHNDLVCWCAVKDKIEQIERDLGAEFETFYNILCASCTTGVEVSTTGAATAKLLTYITKVQLGCYKDLECYCSARNKIAAIKERFGLVQWEQIVKILCSTCGPPPPPTRETPSITTTPPVVPPPPPADEVIACGFSLPSADRYGTGVM